MILWYYYYRKICTLIILYLIIIHILTKHFKSPSYSKLPPTKPNKAANSRSMLSVMNLRIFTPLFSLAFFSFAIFIKSCYWLNNILSRKSHSDSIQSYPLIRSFIFFIHSLFFLLLSFSFSQSSILSLFHFSIHFSVLFFFIPSNTFFSFVSLCLMWFGQQRSKPSFPAIEISCPGRSYLLTSTLISQ